MKTLHATHRLDVSSRAAVRPDGRNSDFHSEDGTIAEQGTIRSRERRSFTGEHPCLSIRRLFSHKRSYRASYAADFYFDGVKESLVLDAADRKGFLALWNDLQVDEPRLWCGCDVGNSRLGNIRLDVLQQREQYAVRHIGR